MTPENAAELPISNAVLATLIPAYTQDESMFMIHDSKWLGRGPDGNIAPGKILEPGENAWAYVAGLNNKSDAHWPLLANAFAKTAGNLGPNGNPSYTNYESLKGGLWKGREAVVVNCDGSAKVVKTHKVNSKTYIVSRNDDPTKNAFNYDPVAKWLTPDCAVLQPIPPAP